MEIEPASDSGRKSGSGCGVRSRGTAMTMFKILLGLSNILNITKENSGRDSGRNRGSGCGRRSRGQQFAAVATVAMALAANSGHGRGRQWWQKQRKRKGRQQSTNMW